MLRDFPEDGVDVFIGSVTALLMPYNFQTDFRLADSEILARDEKHFGKDGSSPN